MIEGDGVGKKALIGVSLAVLATVGVVGGKVYMNNNDNKIENIVKSDEAKEAIEKMLKEQDDKALTPEGKIKSYKIDYSDVKKNPMGGISIKIIINNDEELTIGTIINKYNSGKDYSLGALSFSSKLHKLLYEG